MKRIVLLATLSILFLSYGLVPQVLAAGPWFHRNGHAHHAGNARHQRHYHPSQAKHPKKPNARAQRQAHVVN